MSYLTNVGYDAPSAPDLRQEIEADWKAIYGDDLAVGPAYEGASMASILSGLLSDLLAAHAHEPAADLVANLTPESASGIMLRNLKSIAATYPYEARYSLATLRLGTNDAYPTPIAAGSIARSPVTNINWITLVDAEIPAEGTVDVLARSEFKGPYPAASGSITTIVTNVAGWDTVTSIGDAELGRAAENDADLRPRVEKRGSSRERILDAVRNVEGVTFASVQSNPVSSTEDVDGIPAGAFRIYVDGGADADIAQAIYAVKSSVAGTVGDEYVDVMGSNGEPERIFYSRITQVQVHLIIKLEIDAGTYPADGDAQVKTAAAAFINALANGQTLKNWQIDSSFKHVPGIDAVPEILQGLTDPPTLTDNLVAGPTQRLRCQTANIDVVHV